MQCHRPFLCKSASPLRLLPVRKASIEAWLRADNICRIDEKAPFRVTDSYAMSKQTCEMQADSFINWFPGTSIASLRFHAVKPLEQVTADWKDKPDEEAQHCWAWTHPEAAARACLLAVDADRFEGHEGESLTSTWSRD